MTEDEPGQPLEPPAVELVAGLEGGGQREVVGTVANVAERCGDVPA